MGEPQGWESLDFSFCTFPTQAIPLAIENLPGSVGLEHYCIWIAKPAALHRLDFGETVVG